MTKTNAEDSSGFQTTANMSFLERPKGGSNKIMLQDDLSVNGGTPNNVKREHKKFMLKKKLNYGQEPST